ncbi:MAG: hypothetical protein NTY51_05275 [Deltaproteobacteria bacterium]|nr:hypothetical protein [Deltaproteobacteria bacterium]
MDEFDAAEVLRLYWLGQSDTISSQKIILAMCPFCGKGDRIHLLNHEDTNFLASNDNYWAAWEKLSSLERLPGICRFCLNVVIIRGGQAEMPG